MTVHADIKTLLLAIIAAAAFLAAAFVSVSPAKPRSDMSIAQHTTTR